MTIKIDVDENSRNNDTVFETTEEDMEKLLWRSKVSIKQTFFKMYRSQQVLQKKYLHDSFMKATAYNQSTR